MLEKMYVSQTKKRAVAISSMPKTIRAMLNHLDSLSFNALIAKSKPEILEITFKEISTIFKVALMGTKKLV
jgi:hypothetical protein